MKKRYLVPFSLVLLAGCAPRLTMEQRRRDVAYLAEWAGAYHACVEVNHRIGGLPDYASLVPEYTELAAQAANNEEFLRVVWGYANLIGASGHGYLIEEESLRGYMLDSLLKGGKGMSDIPWHQFYAAAYWPKLLDKGFAHPPFGVRREGNAFHTCDDWTAKGVRIPRGSEIVRVNGMSCSEWADHLKKDTWLRYARGDVDWVVRRLLIVYEGKQAKAWDVVFRTPEGVERAAVPCKRGWPDKTAEFFDWRKDNCVCVELAPDVGYVRVKAMVGFLGEADAKKIRRFLADSSGGYNKLIIDVRGNGGGSPFYVYDVLIRPFLDAPATYRQTTGVKRRLLADTEPAYMDRLRTGVSRWAWDTEIKEIEPPEGFDGEEWVFYEITREVKPGERYPFAGRMYVLIDGGCGSATDTYADAIKRTGLATLVGRATAGSLGGYLMAPTVRLPESGMIFRMEADLDINADGTFNELTGVRPDVELPESALPQATEKGALLKDAWIRTIIDAP